MLNFLETAVSWNITVFCIFSICFYRNKFISSILLTPSKYLLLISSKLAIKMSQSLVIKGKTAQCGIVLKISYRYSCRILNCQTINNLRCLCLDSLRFIQEGKLWCHRWLFSKSIFSKAHIAGCVALFTQLYF